MFDAMELDDAEYRLKPMNCPGHIFDLQRLVEVVSGSAGALGRTGDGVPL